jgi:signal peptidase II
MSDSVHHYEPIQSEGGRNWRPLLVLISLLVVGLDRLSKLWVVHHVNPGGAITVVPRAFRITHVMNTGAAFSLFSESASPELVRNSLIGFSIFAVLVVLVLLWRVGRTLTITSVALALILGGAIGNMYDRIRYGYVVDFLEVHIIHYHWPDFNVADSCIVIGALLLMLEIFRPAKKDVEL